MRINKKACEASFFIYLGFTAIADQRNHKIFFESVALQYFQKIS